MSFQQMLKESYAMKMSSEALNKMAEQALEACLSKVPFLRIKEMRREPESREIRPDLLVKLALPEGELYLLIEFKANGQPRFARQAVNELLRYRGRYPKSYGVFMAPYISPRAAEICAQEDIGYIDLAGNCRLSFARVYIEQEGKPNIFARRRELRSLYSPRAERILRVLLNDPRRAWKVAGLADEAQVSLGQVSNVKRLLTDREWVQAEEDGFVLVEPDQLLSEWVQNYSFRRNPVEDFYSLKSVAEIESALQDICGRKGIRYALTGFSGAARFAPAVRYQRAMAYVEETREDLVSMLGLRRVSSGANLTILSPYDEGIFYGSRRIDGVEIASPVQIYLDLSAFRGRGEEAAQALLEQVIRPGW